MSKERPHINGRHRGRCTICNHPDLEQIEKHYLRFGVVAETSRAFGLSADALRRHIRYLETRRKERRRTEGRHRGRCTICQHPQKNEIEKQFMNFELLADISRYFNLSQYALWRHVHYYGLDLRRVDDDIKAMKELLTEETELLEPDVRDLKATDLEGLAKHLDNLEGRIQKRRQNEADREMKKKHYELKIENIIRQSQDTNSPVSRLDAIDILETQFPDIKQLISAEPEKL